MDINWNDKLITIYTTDDFMTQLDTNLYELDTDAFRKAIKSREDDEDGIVYPDTHTHNATYTVAGTTYAETILIANGYRVQFEDGQYTVKLTGSNNNIFDVSADILVRNQVQVIPSNSAGLIVSSNSISDADKIDIVNRIWDELIENHTGDGSVAQSIKNIEKLTGYKVTKDGDIITIWEDDGVTIWRKYNLANGERIQI